MPEFSKTSRKIESFKQFEIILCKIFCMCRIVLTPAVPDYQRYWGKIWFKRNIKYFVIKERKSWFFIQQNGGGEGAPGVDSLIYNMYIIRYMCDGWCAPSVQRDSNTWRNTRETWERQAESFYHSLMRAIYISRVLVTSLQVKCAALLLIYTGRKKERVENKKRERREGER